MANSVSRLNSGVASPGGDNLEITVTGRQRLCRALVDGEVAKLSDVVFKSGTAEFNGVRSFTFEYKPTVKAATPLIANLRPSVPAVHLEALSCANHIEDQVIVPSATLH